MFFACVEAFRFETTVMSLLQHPNIMGCYGANETDPEPFIVMPLCRMLLYFIKLWSIFIVFH